MPRSARARPSQTFKPPLGATSVDEFLRHTWQQRPLLVRQALPAIAPPLSPEALLALASDDSVQARLVSAFGGRWRLTHGPFDPTDLPALSRKRWTILVQGVNLHNDAAHALMSRFRFIPDARLDDLMISLASDQGGVGPHLDSYDVFLIQLWGRRRWQIAPPGRDALRPGLPLKILADFKPTESWVLEPGDMLYLPPGWAHDGVADGACMTASVGFRAPSRLEFLREFLADAADHPGGADPRFSDPRRRHSRRAAAVPADLHGALHHWASAWRPSPQAIDSFIGRFLTEPAAQVFFESVDYAGFAAFKRSAQRSGLRLDRRTRMAYRSRRVFINGEVNAMPPGAAARLLHHLADTRALTAPQSAQLLQDRAIGAQVFDWAQAGWLHPAG